MGEPGIEPSRDFWVTVVGGPKGYLHRVQEQLRLTGVNALDAEAVREALGDEVYERYNEAGSLVKSESSTS